MKRIPSFFPLVLGSKLYLTACRGWYGAGSGDVQSYGGHPWGGHQPWRDGVSLGAASGSLGTAWCRAALNPLQAFSEPGNCPHSFHSCQGELRRGEGMGGAGGRTDSSFSSPVVAGSPRGYPAKAACGWFCYYRLKDPDCYFFSES